MRDYQDAIAAMFERSIHDALATLPEPACERPAEARRIIGLLVETIAGYAVGSTMRELARAVGTWFGAESAALVHAAAPAPRARRATTCDEWLEPTIEPRLIDVLASELRARLAITAIEIGTAIEAVAARLPGERGRPAAAMFGELARAAHYDDRLAREIATGWSCACAAIEHTTMPAIETPRARELWCMWSQLVGNPPPSESRQGALREGYIALVS
jgi:hypothetical protein